MSFSGWKHSFAQLSAKNSSDKVDALPWVHDNSDCKQVAPIRLISSSLGASCSGCMGSTEFGEKKRNVVPTVAVPTKGYSQGQRWVGQDPAFYPEWGWKYKEDKWQTEDESSVS